MVHEREPPYRQEHGPRVLPDGQRIGGRMPVASEFRMTGWSRWRTRAGGEVRTPLLAALVTVSALLSACGHHGAAATQGPTTTTPSPSAQDVAALNSTVHAYFRALSKDDFIHLARYSAGPLHQLWGWSKDEWGMCACPSSHISIQTLDVTQFSP